MWGRRRTENRDDSIREAQAGVRRAEAILARVAAQQPEVDERVGRLEQRGKRNGFGDSLTLAMTRRRTA